MAWIMDDERLGMHSPIKWLTSTQRIASLSRRSLTRKRGMPASVLSAPPRRMLCHNETAEKAAARCTFSLAFPRKERSLRNDTCGESGHVAAKPRRGEDRPAEWESSSIGGRVAAMPRKSEAGFRVLTMGLAVSLAGCELEVRAFSLSGNRGMG